MNLEMLQVADAVAREKGVEREMVIDAMEQALATAARRTYSGQHIRACIDRDSGEISLFHVRTVVEEVEDPENELTLEQGIEIKPDVEIGSEFTDLVPPITLGRVAAQTAKQVINQRIREAERARVIAEYEPRVGELITGIVKRVERGNVYIDLGRGEAVMYREDLLQRETFRQGDRVRAYLREVRNQPKGPILFMSRADAGMVQSLFEIEVPEIQDGVVEIQAIARDPGSRTKIAVISSDPGVDPVGACVGMRGARVQAVMNELHGEKIDIIEWTADPAAFVINALAPAVVQQVMLDEENESIEIAVSDDQLAIAIGRRGQNVRLASELTGWNIELMSSEDQQEKRKDESNVAINIFQTALDIDEDFAKLLTSEGFITLDDIAYGLVNEIAAIEGLDTDLAAELQSRARNTLLNSALAESNHTETKAVPASTSSTNLLDLSAMNEELASQLEQFGINTVEALADAGIDELQGVEGIERAELEAFIVAAREKCGWFD
ncbi:MAG: transcription termination factor NusA [Mariprofundaceae bacterium]